MINDELLSRFESIDDLPISEEFLAAYEEGKLDPYERLCIEAKFENNPIINALLQDNEIVNFESDNFQYDPLPFSLEEIILPEIPEIDATFRNIYSDIHNLDLEESIRHSIFGTFDVMASDLHSSEENTFDEKFIDDIDIFDNNKSSLLSESPLEDDSFNENISELDL